MSKFLLITKINLLSFFNFQKKSKQNINARKKNSTKLFFFILILAYLAFYIYYISKELVPGFVVINKPTSFLALMFAITSIYILFYNLFKVKNILFDFKDYDLLMSLPISRNTIIFSKLVSLYLLNLLYTFIIMIPSLVAYNNYVSINFELLYGILLFIVPIIPLLVSLIIGIFLAYLESFFKNKNIGSYIMNLSLVFLVLFLSLKIGKMETSEIANSSLNLIERIDNIYPLTSLFTNLLTNFHFFDLFIFIVIPIILMMIFTLIIDKFYITIRTRLLKTDIKSDYQIKEYRSKKGLFSLYHKEIKRFFASPLYVINTIFGLILLSISILSIILFKDDRIANLMKIENLSDFLRINIFFIISLCCVLSSTTAPSISLEGKSLWIMKMIPQSVDNILLSKILVNLTFLVPAVLIFGTFFGIYLHFTLGEFILCYLMPLAYSIFIAMLGLLFNLMFPRFDYDNEIKVIKQSLATTLTIFAGLFSVLIPFTMFKINFDYCILVTAIVFFVDIILTIALHYYGQKKFIHL